MVRECGISECKKGGLGIYPQPPFSWCLGEPIAADSRASKAMVKERVDQVLEQVRLTQASASLFPHEFSGGQRQRIALARALVSNPKCIILDEPVSALDISVRAQTMNLLRDLQETFGVAYLMIAHDLAAVKYVSNRIGVMYLGKLVEVAESEDLYSRPLHPYTRALLSAALHSHPDANREEIVLRGEVPSPLNTPAGRRFHPRCYCALPICSEVETPSTYQGDLHQVACHLNLR